MSSKAPEPIRESKIPGVTHPGWVPVPNPPAPPKATAFETLVHEVCELKGRVGVLECRVRDLEAERESDYRQEQSENGYKP